VEAAEEPVEQVAWCGLARPQALGSHSTWAGAVGGTGA
jgi:hypothetical protein